jgi:hypothetical protein
MEFFVAPFFARPFFNAWFGSPQVRFTLDAALMPFVLPPSQTTFTLEAPQ